MCCSVGLAPPPPPPPLQPTMKPARASAQATAGHRSALPPIISVPLSDARENSSSQKNSASPSLMLAADPKVVKRYLILSDQTRTNLPLAAQSLYPSTGNS